MKDVFYFLDNENYRYRGYEKMNEINTEKYFNFLDNEKTLWMFNTKPIKLLSEQESFSYFSFLDNEKEMAKYKKPVIRYENKNKILSITPEVSKRMPVSNTASMKSKNDAIVDVYMKIAEKDFNELYRDDNGLLFRIYLQKLVPLTTDLILNWGSDEMTRSALFTNEVSKVTHNYHDIKGYDILEKILAEVRDKPSLWKKLTGYETQLTQARLNLITIQDRLKPLLKKANDLVESSEKNAKKITLLSHCLAIVSQCAEEENQSGGIYQYLYSRRDTLFSAVLQANIVPSKLKALIDEATTLIMRIDETVSITIPTIELARASNV